MSLFDILGPVMIGPSSSHTAGAVKIGYIAGKLLGEKVVKAQLNLYGSFLATARGHGTDLALVAGLLGMQPDDINIPISFEIAKKEGLEFSFGTANLRQVHPNTVVLELESESGRSIEVMASSIGGGRIKVCRIDGIDANFTGDFPTLVVHNMDKPGYVTEVTRVLAKEDINIASMQIYRDSRGGRAVMIIECDQEVPEKCVERLESLDGIFKVTYLTLED